MPKKQEQKIESVPVESLVPYARNARTHSDAQVAQIAGSIKEFGFVNPVLIDASGGIIAGHGRVLAARKLGMEAVPCLRVEHLSETQKRAYILADNKLAINAGWDDELLKVELDELKLDGFDLALTGFDLKELEAITPTTTDADADPQTDKAEELREKWGVETGQMWALGDHRILCGDSTKAEDVARVMGGERSDCVFTSPPYAVGVDYGETYADNIDSLRRMLPMLAQIWFDVSKDGCYAVVNFGDVVSGSKIIGTNTPCQYTMALEYWPVFRSVGWSLWSQRIWCKPIGRVSAPWCASSNRGATNWEHLWTWRKPGGSATKPKTGNAMSSMHGWCDSSKMDGVEIGKSEHGAGMATGIAAWMIHVHTKTGDVIHEPFCGTGTTIVACEQLGRKCRAIEISPAYVAVALQRWADATGKTPVLMK